MPRRRKAIRREDYLAAALACLLPQGQRDELRAAKVQARDVIRLFSPDHIVLHAHDGSDAWWNLHPRLRPEHREKSRRDTYIAAKVKRLQRNMFRFGPADLIEALKATTRNARTGFPRVKRKIASRPFPPRGSRSRPSK